MRRNRRAGVEDRWRKTVTEPDGTKRTVPSARDGIGLRWLARYVDQDGRENTKAFARKTDAQRWLDEVTAAVVTGQYVDPKAGQITFRDYAERWRKKQVQRPSSRVHVETMLRRHAYPTFGGRHLTAILPSDIQTWIKGLELAPATVGVLHGIVSTIFKSAIRDRRVASNPCDGTKLPKVQRPHDAQAPPHTPTRPRLPHRRRTRPQRRPRRRTQQATTLLTRPGMPRRRSLAAALSSEYGI
ncbi:N-terminal phage integrase SAM-like domain-containing protein [Candidatus Mycobacterium methanotrophicum]|uniref:N-terminal phage integrase SAM-like domain-containing protein n=1 Tax=Candidatus Mycobacterium methanotrophicum TaxID=2943498 RepID=A0ABY4QGD1_9MYCO|nr:N-terminal phage integrase SAM-like domain-containing protein [Candidatus Mycobacterium methanotrophicum]UQX09551.1 N-terminal phage integrase SAM-like domain-containing protein [Candidatus Mycobacterium methanotrophicum]